MMLVNFIWLWRATFTIQYQYNVKSMIQTLKMAVKMHLKGDRKREEKKYMRILRGRWRAWKSRTKALMDLKEERSKWSSVTRAFAFCLRISVLAFSAAPMFRAPITTWAPLFAITLAVSIPIPPVPPFTMTITRQVNIIFV